MQTEFVDIAATSPPLVAHATQVRNGKARAETILGFKPRGAPWTTTTTITPEQAKMLLAVNPGQRNIKRPNVDYFKSLIERGSFYTTHQGMAFNVRGEMIDGQHRCLACVETNTPIAVQVSFYQPDEHFAAYDRGAGRSLTDDLVTAGIADGPIAALAQAAVRLLYHFDAGRIPWVQTIKPTFSDMIAVIERHPLLLDTARWVYSHQRAPKAPPAPFTAFLTIFREVNEQKAMLLAEQIVTGTDLGERDPAMALRNSLLVAGSRRFKQARQAFTVRFIRAWNAHLAGRKVSSLQDRLDSGELPRVAGRKQV